jgi:glycosyltransferase involved in cell wall biosynthesis
MRDELLKKRHLQSVNIPPLIEADEPSGQSVPSSRAFITLVGLDPWKGGELALKLAGAMPHRQFLFVTGNRASSELLAQAARLDNIELAGWTNDMSKHYRRTRLIIMPSHWAEPFGRVAVEAGRYQIPTIATATGGLPEAVGAGGILLPRAASKRDWVGAIESLDDEAQYNHLASLASEHSRRFSPGRVFEKFDLAVRQHTGLDLFEGDVGSNTPAE